MGAKLGAKRKITNKCSKKKPPETIDFKRFSLLSE
uniref:Uncharacterized protein n=1 Tax=Firmicutes phage HS10 TaxID=3056392 RepID=A0AA49X878_9VIRU|nr:MAG: hypothetical protein [Firmicutes phage HS10]